MSKVKEAALAAMRPIYFRSMQETEDTAARASVACGNVYEAALAKNKERCEQCERVAKEALNAASLPPSDHLSAAVDLALANYTARAELAGKTMQRAGEEAMAVFERESLAAVKECKLEAMMAQEVAEVAFENLSPEDPRYQRAQSAWARAVKEAKEKLDATIKEAERKRERVFAAAASAYQEAIGPAKQAYDQALEERNAAHRSRVAEAEQSYDAALMHARELREQGDKEAFDAYDAALKDIEDRRKQERRLRVEAWLEYLAGFQKFCATVE
jgi:hypothetical protein